VTPAYVTDTHPLVFHTQGARGGKGLSAKAARIFVQAEAQRAIVYVPTVVLWELTILARIGRVKFRGTFRQFTADLFSNPAYQSCELSTEHVLFAQETLPNSDPFDGLIAGIARGLDLPLITRDAMLRDLRGLETVW
jgi:PIN domain nuclease of toxin-antitoxin system